MDALNPSTRQFAASCREECASLCHENPDEVAEWVATS